MVVAILTAAVFLKYGFDKFAGSPAALAPFEEFGWPRWTIYATAVAEIAGAVGVLVPRARMLAGAGLALLMVGAGFTNLANGHPEYLWLNVVMCAAALFLAWDRLRRRAGTGARRGAPVVR